MFVHTRQLCQRRSLNERARGPSQLVTVRWFATLDLYHCRLQQVHRPHPHRARQAPLGSWALAVRSCETAATHARRDASGTQWAFPTKFLHKLNAGRHVWCPAISLGPRCLTSPATVIGRRATSFRTLGEDWFAEPPPRACQRTPTVAASQDPWAATFPDWDAVSFPRGLREGKIPPGLAGLALCGHLHTTSTSLVGGRVRARRITADLLRILSGADCSIKLGDLRF